jgi:hypothetical protein
MDIGNIGLTLNSSGALESLTKVGTAAEKAADRVIAADDRIGTSAERAAARREASEARVRANIALLENAKATNANELAAHELRRIQEVTAAAETAIQQRTRASIAADASAEAAIQRRAAAEEAAAVRSVRATEMALGSAEIAIRRRTAAAEAAAAKEIAASERVVVAQEGFGTKITGMMQRVGIGALFAFEQMENGGARGEGAMRRVLRSVGILGLAIGGPEGILIGSVALGFTAIMDFLHRTETEAKKTADRIREHIAGAANAGRADDIFAQAKIVQFGQPFQMDSDGKPKHRGDGSLEINPVSKYAKGAYQGSLADLQGNLADLQNQFYTTTNGFTQIAIQKQIIGVKKQLAPVEALMHDLQAAAANTASQSADNVGKLAGITTTERSPDAKVKHRIDRAALAAAKEEDRTKAMIAALDEEAAASDRMLAARRRGTDAAAKQEVEETVRLQLAQTGLTVGTARYAQVERDIRQTIDNTAAITALNDADKEREKADKARDVAAKKANDEAIAEQKKQMQAVDSLFKSSFTTLFTDITSKGKNAFASLFDAIRTGFIKLLADMAATQLTNRVMGGALGMMLGGVLTPGRAGAQGSSGPAVPWGALGDGDVATSSRFSTAAGYAGIALGGLGVGYGIGGAAHSATMAGLGGALGGAGSGAMIGAAFGSALGPHGAAIGAALGGLTGLVGGLLGFGSAAKEAARQMKEAQTVLALSMASLKADVAHDTLGAGSASIDADRESRRKAIEDAYSGGGSGSDQVRKRNALLAEMNALEDQRIALLKIEYAQSQQYATEDLQVRKLRAQGHLYEADALAFAESQQREYAAAVNAGKDASYLATLQETQRAEAIAHTADVMQAAVRNAPSGFKVSGYGYDFATPAATGGQLSPAAQTPPVIFNFGQGSISVDGSTDPEKVLSAFVIGLRRRAASTVGTNMPLSSALDRIQ